MFLYVLRISSSNVLKMFLHIMHLSMLSPRGGGGGGRERRGRCGAFDILRDFFFKFPTLGTKILVPNRSNIPTQNSAHFFCKFSYYLQYVRFPIL